MSHEPATRPRLVESGFWRWLAWAGARHGPRAWLRFSPPLFGVAFAAALPAQRRRVRRNLRRLVGRRPAPIEHADVARTFAAYAACLAEALASGRPEAALATRRVVGAEHLAGLTARGGAVIVTAHTGAWDAGARLLARDLTAPVTIVMRREPGAAARRVQDAVRAESGVEVVHIGQGPLDALGLLRRLKNGGIVALQIDRGAAGDRGIDVRLCGQPFRMPEGPLRLAATAQVPLLSVFARRVGFFDYEFVVGPRITLSRRPAKAELQAAAHRLAGELERFLRANPTQWFDFDANS